MMSCQNKSNAINPWTLEDIEFLLSEHLKKKVHTKSYRKKKEKPMILETALCFKNINTMHGDVIKLTQQFNSHTDSSM